MPLSFKPIIKADIAERLIEAARRGASEYAKAYIDDFEKIVRVYNDGLILKNDVRPTSETSSIETLMVSTILSDVSFFSFPGAGREAVINWMAPGALTQKFKTDHVEISIPNSLGSHAMQSIEAGDFGFGFLMPIDSGTDGLLKSLEPLLLSGRVIPQPERQFFYLDRTRERTWLALPVSPTSPVSSWTIIDPKNGWRPLLVADGSPVSSEDPIFDVLVPFIRGISISDFAKILDDEHDLLFEFRACLKSVLEEVKTNKKTAKEVAQDVLLPRVARIQRKFDTIANLTRLKVGGAVLSVATVALSTFLSAGITAAVAAVATAAAGGAGFAYMGKELASSKSEIAALKDDPTYLLWRLSKAEKH